MNLACLAMIDFDDQRICPFRMILMASYVAMVFMAPSKDRNP